jgi:hypothetical protein
MKAGDDPTPSRYGRGWSWFLITLFPIPFGPWWVTVICLAVFFLLVWRFFKKGDPPTTG